MPRSADASMKGRPLRGLYKPPGEPIRCHCSVSGRSPALWASASVGDASHEALSASCAVSAIEPRCAQCSTRCEEAAIQEAAIQEAAITCSRCGHNTGPPRDPANRAVRCGARMASLHLEHTIANRADELIGDWIRLHCPTGYRAEQSNGVWTGAHKTKDVGQCRDTLSRLH